MNRKRREASLSRQMAIARDVIGVHAIAIITAAELLAEASEQSTVDDWLLLIMAKTRSRYESISPEELQDCCDKITRNMYPKPDKESD
jgi:hypothetical protein